MKRERIPLNGPQSGLNNAFSHLGLPDAPPGPEATVAAAAEKKQSKLTGRVVLRRETAHRGGKTVVVVSGFDERIPQGEIEDLARRLRAACGCGGAVKEREIELQGEQVRKAREMLDEAGFQVAGERA